MVDCYKIIRLLKDVKRKADTSFAAINEKIIKLESQYKRLAEENENLRKKMRNQLENSEIPGTITSDQSKRRASRKFVVTFPSKTDLKSIRKSTTGKLTLTKMKRTKRRRSKKSKKSLRRKRKTSSKRRKTLLN
ncbi:hypothetical protein ABEB36_005600 [Hypothenemus hampei]|uniref:Uncharacterized protein n=1 Tax=Hypothenemus hampei TaxID=57062 RepID=A0ABD1F1G1_HYPHA